MTDASSSLVTKVDQLDTDTHAFLTEVGANTAGIDKALKDNKSNLSAIDNSYAHIVGNTVQAQLAAERTEAFSEAKSLRQAMHLAVAPRPDLWLPLVSNLKLREGFGEVSFSRSTTATYVNKSGQLVTAKANEPRFEKEGVLIEGGSTNYGSISADRSVTSVKEGLFYRVTANKADDQFFKSGYGPLKGADLSKTSITASALVNPLGRRYARFELSWSRDGKTEYVSSKLVDFQGDRTSKDIKLEKMNGEWFRISAKVPHTSGTITGNVGGYVFICDDSGERYFNSTGKEQILMTMPQVEKLPFPTSYIPTNGQPVTRDADTLSFPFYQNMPDAPAACTIAMDFDWQAVMNDPSIPFYATANKGGYYHIYNKSSVDYSEIRWNGTYNHARTGLFNSGINRYVWGFDGANVFDYVNGNTNRRSAYTPEPLEGKKYTHIYLGLRSFYGHFRNVRIWHRALTPEQIAFL